MALPRRLRLALLVLASVAFLVACAILGAAITAGAVGAWFLHVPFADGFTAVLHHPVKGLLLATISGMLGIPTRKTLP